MDHRIYAERGTRKDPYTAHIKKVDNDEILVTLQQLSPMIYLLLLLLLLLLPHLPMVEPYDQMSPNGTTVTTSKVDDWVLVDTLAYNKSGTIHSLSWRLGDNNNNNNNNSSSSSSSSSTLFAASVHSCQVWQQRVAGQHHHLMQRLPSNITSSSSLVRAVAVSPDGKWLALGT
jgi:hypothetical protein